MSYASTYDHRETASDDIDVATLLAGMGKRKKWIILPTLLALLGSTAFVMMVAPRYTASSDILIENRDTLYTAPGSDSGQTQLPTREIGEDVVQSQAQLVLARDAALEVIRSLNLGALAEFDPAVEGPSALGRVLVLLHLASNPTTASPEDRVLRTFLEKVSAFPTRGSRIISIEATSEDPQLATKIANSLANEYMKRETRAKQDTAVQASGFLLGEINTLRGKVTEAEAKVETFRSSEGLLQGQNSTTITTLQLSELSTQLASARSKQADLMARARLIRESLRNGRIFDVSEINNNELVRRLLEQRSILRGQLALEQRIYLPQHPRIKELSAQIVDLEGQIRSAAERTARSLENDARTSLARVEQLNQDIGSQKTVASKANDSEVQLRQFEREAKALRDQLETYLARYNDAQARDRENSVAADARIVSQAIVPSTAAFPKKIPIISIATLGTLFLTTVLLLTGQLLGAATGRTRQRPQRQGREAFIDPAPSFVTEPPQPFVHPVAANIPDPAKAAARPKPVPMPSSVGSPLPTLPTAANSGLPLDARIVLDPDSGAARSIRQVATGLRAHRLPGRAACIVIVSDQPQAGATSSAIGLARVLVREGKTILIDLHARKPGLNRLLGDARPMGLSNILANEASFADAIHRDRGSRAHVLPVGDAGIDPMQSASLTVALDALSQTYDFMVIDAGVCGRQRAELLSGADMAMIVTTGSETSVSARSARGMLSKLGAQDIVVMCSSEPGAGDSLRGVNLAAAS
jgi:polysaccharide biosynthesis transport protein